MDWREMGRGCLARSGWGWRRAMEELRKGCRSQEAKKPRVRATQAMMPKRRMLSTRILAASPPRHFFAPLTASSKLCLPVFKNPFSSSPPFSGLICEEKLRIWLPVYIFAGEWRETNRFTGYADRERGK